MGFCFQPAYAAIRSWLILLYRAGLRRSGLCPAFEPSGHRQRGREPAAAPRDLEHGDREAAVTPSLSQRIEAPKAEHLRRGGGIQQWAVLPKEPLSHVGNQWLVLHAHTGLDRHEPFGET